MKQRKLTRAVFRNVFISLLMLLALSLSAQAAGTEDVFVIEYEGVDYATVTLSGHLEEARTTFTIDGENVDWFYDTVAQNSTCTIEPTNFGGHLYITLDSYKFSNGVYTTDLLGDWMATVLWADGEAAVGYGYPPYSEDQFKPYFPSPGHPASFTFGKNSGVTTVYEDTYSFTLYADGTLYVVRCEVYDRAGEFLFCYNLPYFIETAPSGSTSPAIVGSFTDVSTTAYYADPVAWAVDKNVTNGTSATSFSPDTDCTTAQILTFLWRAQGSPEPTIQNPFRDVADDAYYAKAAAWAYEKDLVSGATFNGDAPCTRSTTVTYLWTLSGKPSAKGNQFTDVSATSDYAQAVAWAVDKDITSGTSETTFSPDDTCTRGQIVTFLYRYFVQ